MATSKCAACGKTSFELKEVEPKNSRVKYNFIQCAACGVVVGVADYVNLGAGVAAILKGLEDASRKVDNMESRLARMEAAARVRK